MSNPCNVLFDMKHHRRSAHSSQASLMRSEGYRILRRCEAGEQHGVGLGCIGRAAERGNERVADQSGRNLTASFTTHSISD
jgi:hypothetical protein